jgi:hypothetical protein
MLLLLLPLDLLQAILLLLQLLLLKKNNNNKPKSVETSQVGKVIILRNQQVQTDRTIPNNKPDIIIRDNEEYVDSMWNTNRKIRNFALGEVN